MGSKYQTATSTSTTSIPQMSEEERKLREYFMSMGQEIQGQMGDLSSLASGGFQQLSPEAIEHLRKSVDAPADIQARNFAARSHLQRANLGNELQSRGQSDSSIGLAKRLFASNTESQGYQDIESQRAGAYSTAAMQLPFQQAQTQLGANQLLSNQLMGFLQPLLEGSLRERLASSTTTGDQSSTASGFTLGELAAIAPAFR